MKTGFVNRVKNAVKNIFTNEKSKNVTVSKKDVDSMLKRVGALPQDVKLRVTHSIRKRKSDKQRELIRLRKRSSKANILVTYPDGTTARMAKNFALNLYRQKLVTI
ncbi:MAG: hypothetical protein J0M18_21565 [Ignavibacteria bacterium]|nr:hypothetical protein [Ignavibacteria bacterium]